MSKMLCGSLRASARYLAHHGTLLTKSVNLSTPFGFEKQVKSKLCLLILSYGGKWVKVRLRLG
jgi:hypothetical protein